MPWALTILCLAALALGVWTTRARGWRVGVPWAVAVALLGVAWVNPPTPFGAQPTIALFVDLSPSTRGLWFRDHRAVAPVQSALSRFADIHVYSFANQSSFALEADRPFVEIPSPRSVLASTDCDAIVLLSDGQLSGPATSTPIFAVFDPQDASATDARITDIALDRGTLVAQVVNTDTQRELTWPDGSRDRVATGTTIARHELAAPMTDDLLFSLNAGDLWPENDRLSVPIVRERSDRYWIGGDAPEGFQPRAPDSISLSELLGTSIVVLNDVPIEALSTTFQQNLARYVRDIGGSVVVGGGSHSLSAGGYGNSLIDALSPLASVPPSPTQDLFLIVDSSGSMAATIGDGRTKLDAAIDALQAIDRVVPETWTVRAGNVARDLRWWPTNGVRVNRPVDLVASGPTNLAAAIEQVLDVAASHAKRLVVISDGQAQANTLLAVAPRVKQEGLTIDWLALPPADANGALAQIVRDSGGHVLLAGAADTWRTQAEQIARGALAQSMIAGPFNVELAGQGTISLEEINHTFQRDAVESIASISTNGTRIPVVAHWNVGLGKVTTLAFKLDPSALASFASAEARAPRDPRFSTRLGTDSIEIDARDANGPMNALRLSLLMDDATSATPLEQVAPGRYRVALDRSDRSRIARVRLDDTVIDLVPVPAHAAIEFDSIGVDVEALAGLAQNSGGKLVARDQVASIRTFLASTRTRGVRTPSLVAAALCLAISLIASRRPAGS